MVTQDHGACSALSHAAPEMWPAQTEIVIQNIEQRCRRVDLQGARLVVHLQGDRIHETSLHSFSPDANFAAVPMWPLSLSPGSKNGDQNAGGRITHL
jgi:hypothetical protein